MEIYRLLDGISLLWAEKWTFMQNRRDRNQEKDSDLDISCHFV